MAKVRQRTWTVPGQRTKRKAWGYVDVDKTTGKQIRVFKSEWTKEQAEDALAKHLLKVEQKPTANGITLGEACSRFLATRSGRGNLRSRGDRNTVRHLLDAFGKDKPIASISASVVSAYRDRRASTFSKYRKDVDGQPRVLGAASVNRPQAILRRILKLAVEEWQVLDAVPRVRMEREPQADSAGSHRPRRGACWTRVARAGMGR